MSRKESGRREGKRGEESSGGKKVKEREWREKV